MRLGLVLSIVLVAGCVGPATRPAPVAEAPEMPSIVTDALTGCTEAGVFFMLPFDRLARFLPEGLVPRDAQALLATPAPVGKGILFFNAFACEGSGLEGGPLRATETAIMVEAPVVDPPVDEGVPFHFYDVARIIPAGALFDATAALGLAVSEGTPEVRVTPTATGAAIAEGRLEDADGEVYAFEVTAPKPDRLGPGGRFWQVVEGGLAFTEYRLTTAIAAGGATCTLRADAAAAEVAGTTSCPPESTLGFTAPRMDVEIEIVRLEGATFTASG